MSDERLEEQILGSENEQPEGSEPQESKEQAVPFSQLTVYIVENVMRNFIKDEAKFREFALKYEQSTLPLLEKIDFDGALTRILGSKALDDKQVVLLGLGWVGLTTVLNALPYIKLGKKRKEASVDDREAAGKGEGDSRA